MNKKFLIGILFLFVGGVTPSYASIRLNEIYPAPPSGESEWIELYNDGNTAINVTGYTLTDLVNNQIAFPAATLEPLSYLIVNSSNILNNGGDTIILKDNEGLILDLTSYTESFNSSKSYAKCQSTNSWVTTSLITKSQSNEGICPPVTPSFPTATPEATPTPYPTAITTPTPSPTLTPPISASPTPALPTPTVIPSPIFSITPSPTATPTPTPVFPSYTGIYISEVLVAPTSGEHEWIELYNDNDFEATLYHWYLDDEENQGSSPKEFTLTLPPKSYRIVELVTNIYNNAGDIVRLLDNNKNPKHSFRYFYSEKEKTWGINSIKDLEYCMQIPTRETQNRGCEEELDDVTETGIVSTGPTTTPTPTPYKTESAQYTTRTPKQIAAPTNILFKKTVPLDFQPSPAFEKKPQPIINSEPVVLGSYHEKYNFLPFMKGLTLGSFLFSFFSLCSLIIRLTLPKVS